MKNQGFRYHMSNIMAAIGIAQLDRISNFKKKRQDIAKNYVLKLKDIDSINFLDFNYDEIMPHIFVIKVKNRNKLREYLLSNNIECGIHYKPNHLLTIYKKDYKLPSTEKIYKEILTLPCHFDLSKDEQMHIIKKIKEFYE